MQTYNFTRQDLEKSLINDVASRSFLFCLKWPSGFRCPVCGHGQAHEVCGGKFWTCSARGCIYRESARKGTMLEGSKKPVQTWLKAFALFLDGPGIPATQLKVRLGLGSYATAWMWMQKIRSTLDTASHPEKKYENAGSKRHASQFSKHGWHGIEPLLRSGIRVLNASSPKRPNIQPLKRWLLEIYGGTVSAKHLRGYEVEFCFWASPLQQARRLLGAIGQGGVPTWWQILGRIGPSCALIHVVGREAV